MLDSKTKQQINNARDILVGKVPTPQAQIEQITIALIYKFMDDMDRENESINRKAIFLTNNLKPFMWKNLISKQLSGDKRLELYSKALKEFSTSTQIPEFFRTIFKSASLPYNDSRVLNLFLKEINNFSYDQSEKLGDAFEYLLSISGAQSEAGQFRTPRHIIDFIVEIIAPQKDDKILDPACGTAGFLISAYKYIIKCNSSNFNPNKTNLLVTQQEKITQKELIKNNKYCGDKLTSTQRIALASNIHGYDISPEMVRLSLVNLYLHDFNSPKVTTYDTLTNYDKWNDNYDVILANPPFMTPKGGIKPHNRFSIMANRAEVLFVDYIAEHLAIKGRAGIIVPEGIIFQAANAYKSLRKNLIEDWGLYCVISLPSGVFQPYSGVKTSVLLLDKTQAKNKNILFINIQNDGFDLGAKRNKIDKNDLPKACSTIKHYQKMGVIKKDSNDFALIVKKNKIAEDGDYNLSANRYKEEVDYSNVKWDMVALGDVCEIYNGSTPKKTENKYWENGEIPWFTIDDIRKQGRVITRTKQKITQAGLNNTSVKLLPKNTVLICCTASVGEYAITEIKLTTNQQFNGLVIKNKFETKLEPKFLFLLSSTFKNELKKLSGKSTFDFVSVKKVKTIKIPLPPLKIQQQIVAEIEAYQKVIDGAKQVIKYYKPTLKINPDWDMVALGDVCEITSSKRVFQKDWKNKGIPFYRAREIVKLVNQGFVKNDLFISEEMYCEYSHKFGYPKEGDLMITGVGTLGFCYRVNKHDKFYFKDGNIIWLKNFSNKVNSNFIKQLFENKFVKKQIALFSSGGTVGTYTITNAKKTKIPLPPLKIQQQIVAEIEAEQKAIAECKKLITSQKQKIKTKMNEVYN